jgi:hypothetical protein
VLAAVLGGLIPMLQRPELGRPAEDSGSIVFVTLWLLAIACALGAARPSTTAWRP